MNRFRKRSDSRRNEPLQGTDKSHAGSPPLNFPIVTQVVDVYRPPELPSLPAESDFRASLILPDLSRRFTLLRSSSGTPFSVHDLRSKFAEQRAKGEENQISEEEEEMLLDMLNRLRSSGSDFGSSSKYPSAKSATGASSTGPVSDRISLSPASTIRHSAQAHMASSNVAHDAVSTLSSSSRASRRHSNQLFAGQSRDAKYMRKPSVRTIVSNRSVLSATPSESTTGSTANALIDTYSYDILGPTTSSISSPSVSGPSSPVEGTASNRPSILSQLSSLEDSAESLSGGSSSLQLNKQLTNSQLKRMSMSLEQVIKEIEDESEDQVLVPRSRVNSQRSGNTVEADRSRPELPLVVDDESTFPEAITEDGSTRTIWVADVDNAANRSPSPYRAGGSVSPGPRVPGYIPGMPRPVTPAREDQDEFRSHSSTPRAVSPSSYIQPGSGNASSPASVSNSYRQNKGTSPTPYDVRSTSPTRSTSPLQRSPTGKAALDERHKSYVSSTDRLSPIPQWRRPSSPFSNNSTAFQPLNGASRPSTPSSVTWTVSNHNHNATQRKTLGRNGTLLGQNKNLSNANANQSQEIANGSRAKRLTSDSSNGTVRPPFSSHPTTSGEETSPSGSPSKTLLDASMLSGSTLGVSGRELTSSMSSLPPTSGSDSWKSNPAKSASGESLSRSLKAMSPLLTPPRSPLAHRSSDSSPYIPHLYNNSSRSSLVSAGSSYHSWEEDAAFGSGFINNRQSLELPWHDLSTDSNPELAAYHNRTGNRYQEEPENILRQYTGLSKSDLLSIQGKLVEAASTRTRMSETARSPSALRRRRPSTSQSNHSTGAQSRTASPAPQAPKFEASWTSDSSSKASALLNSVLDSIQQLENSYELEPRELEPPECVATDAEVGHVAHDSLTLSSPGRRNKDLAEILFGPSSSPILDLSETNRSPMVSFKEQGEELAKSESQDDPSVTPKAEETPLSPKPLEEQAESRSTLVTDRSDLMRQVEERAAAAMLALQRSPQESRFPNNISQITKKKVHPHEISGPLFVQSSASIDKIPTIPTTGVASNLPARPTLLEVQQRSTKLSISRRIKNSLRSKGHQQNAEEITPWTNDYVGPFSTSPRADNRSLTPSKGSSMIGSSSATDLNAQRPAQKTSSSPPASAGNSLKSFMSRFRKKAPIDSVAESAQKNVSTNGLTTNAITHDVISSTPIEDRHSFNSTATAPLLTRRVSRGHGNTDNDPVIPTAPSISRQPTETPTIVAPSSPPTDTAALKRLYDAAESLGLDQSALNEFLSRSNSVTKASLHRNGSIASKFTDALHAPGPVIPELDDSKATVNVARSDSRQRSHAPDLTQVVPRRRREVGDRQSVARNTIIRRTIIYASNNGSSQDIAAFINKSSKNRKRTSGLSLQSGRSVHDRVPTPPPFRAKRQSAQSPSPPVPSLPSPLPWSHQAGLTSSSRLTLEISPTDRSAYDPSLYDMYASLDGSGVVPSPDLLDAPKTPMDDMPSELEEGQALEVIELANGETIWSIVNGLRSDDVESCYPSRGSIDSDFSAMPQHDGGSDIEQLYFKEHTSHKRTGSNSSNVSKYAKRRSQAVVGPRPETKVFHSSSAHIARLIEELSNNTEAGTFNIKPNQRSPFGHGRSGSQTDSELHWALGGR